MTTRKTDDGKTVKPATELRDENLEQVSGGASRNTTVYNHAGFTYILPYIEQDN